MDLNLATIKKEIIFLAIVGLLLGFYAPVRAVNLEKETPKKSNFQAEKEEIGGFKEVVPKIDSMAAFVVREEKAEKERDNAKFPENFWVFLFGTYLFLLVFNLPFGFKGRKKVQWFWELLITLLALWTWKKLDPEQNFRWFFYCILESGIIIYFFYLHSFLLPSKKES